MSEDDPIIPLLMTAEELDRLVPTVLYVEAWVSRVKEEIQAALEAGAHFDHAYLAAKNAIRKWDTEEDLVKASLKDLLLALGKPASEDVVAPRKVVTPAAAEKLVGKKIFSEQMSALVTAESSGYNLKLR